MSERLPRVIATSVIRSAHQGESHGGVYEVDLATGDVQQLLDWDRSQIDWSGRGGDRGLRGVAVRGSQVFLAASDELFVYGWQQRSRNARLELEGSYTCPYLKHCHEIDLGADSLFLTSTGYDSILEFDLQARCFNKGYCARPAAAEGNLGQQGWKRAIAAAQRLGKRQWGPRPRLTVYDPRRPGGPSPGDLFHINSVTLREGAIFLSGCGLPALLSIEGDRLREVAALPFHTHNARPFGSGALFNHTSADQIVYADLSGNVIEAFEVMKYPESRLANVMAADHARQGFGRGLCVTEPGWIVGGSSPATISVYQLGRPGAIRSVNITMDVRNAIHGLIARPARTPEAETEGLP